MDFIARASFLAARSEKDIYEALGLAFIEPELREGRDEIKLSKNRELPTLVKLKDLRGILHAHTIASDGVNTLSSDGRCGYASEAFHILVSPTILSLLITPVGLHPSN